MTAIRLCNRERTALQTTNMQTFFTAFNVDEFLYVVKRKFLGKFQAVDRLLTSISFELAYTPQEMEQDLFEIRDRNNYPALYTAI